MFESTSVTRETVEVSNRNLFGRSMPTRLRWRRFGARNVLGSVKFGISSSCEREREVFQHWERFVHKRKEFMQNRRREVEVNMAYAITQQERVVYS